MVEYQISIIVVSSNAKLLESIKSVCGEIIGVISIKSPDDIQKNLSLARCLIVDLTKESDLKSFKLDNFKAFTKLPVIGVVSKKGNSKMHLDHKFKIDGILEYPLDSNKAASAIIRAIFGSH